MSAVSSSEPCRDGSIGSAMAPRLERRAVGLLGGDSHDDGVEKCLRIAPILSPTACLFSALGGSWTATQQRDPQRRSHTTFLRPEIPELGGHLLGWLYSDAIAALALPQQPYSRFS